MLLETSSYIVSIVPSKICGPRSGLSCFHLLTMASKLPRGLVGVAEPSCKATSQRLVSKYEQYYCNSKWDSLEGNAVAELVVFSRLGLIVAAWHSMKRVTAHSSNGRIQREGIIAANEQHTYYNKRYAKNPRSNKT